MAGQLKAHLKRATSGFILTVIFFAVIKYLLISINPLMKWLYYIVAGTAMFAISQLIMAAHLAISRPPVTFIRILFLRYTAIVIDIIVFVSPIPLLLIFAFDGRLFIYWFALFILPFIMSLLLRDSICPVCHNLFFKDEGGAMRSILLPDMKCSQCGTKPTMKREIEDA